MRLLHLTLFAVLLPAAWGQAAIQLTPADTEFFHHFLDSFDDNTSVLFGLNQQEVASVRATIQSYHSALSTYRLDRAAVLQGKQTLSPSDQASLNTLAANFDSTVQGLAQRILTSLRPERAAYLRLQAQLIAQALAGAKKRVQDKAAGSIQ